MTIIKKITKTLSANDTGETGGHQAGMLIPKAPRFLSFFPVLDPTVKNPRISLYFFEEDHVTKWPFEFIYYNGKFFGGTRNEYRLTWMTQYLRAKNAKTGDRIELLLDDEGRRHISLKRLFEVSEDEEGVLKLRGGWKLIDLK
jgi:Restriction endonuclease EcoRII, N-terminal